MKESVSFSDFEKLDIRVGTIIDASVFSEALKPAYKLIIDFGELGIKKSSAQITQLYTPDLLPGKQVIAVVNFKPKQIANFISECLILGVVGEEGGVILLEPGKQAQNGQKIG